MRRVSKVVLPAPLHPERPITFIAFSAPRLPEPSQPTSLPATNAKRLRKGATRRSNPVPAQFMDCFAPPAITIPSFLYAFGRIISAGRRCHARAFSSEVDTGSREENASKQKHRASVLIPSEPKRL